MLRVAFQMTNVFLGAQDESIHQWLFFNCHFSQASQL